MTIDTTIMLSLCCFDLGFGQTTKAHPDAHAIRLNEVPTTVQDTIRQLAKESKVDEIGKSTDDGKTLFEVIIKKPSSESLFVHPAKGHILEVETRIRTASIPRMLRRIIRRRFPTAHIGESSWCKELFYRISMIASGVETEYIVSPDGVSENDDEESTTTSRLSRDICRVLHSSQFV